MNEAVRLPTHEEARETMARLEERIHEQNRVVEDARGRRAEVAFEASQGDPDALRTLAQCEEDERRAESEMRNLRLALGPAKARVEQALLRETSEEDANWALRFDELREELLVYDDDIEELLDLLREKLDGRGAIQKQLAHMLTSKLNRPVYGVGNVDHVWKSLCVAIGEEHLGPHLRGRIGFLTRVPLRNVDALRFKRQT